MAIVPHIFALALAAAQPAAEAAAPAPDARALLDLFDRVCARGEDAPGGFAAVEWSAFPQPLRLMNTYNHGGTFLRSEAPSVTYVARTRGEAHMGAGLETRCGVAVRGADASQVIALLAERTGARAMPAVTTGDLSMTMLISDRGYTVYSTEDRWVIVRSLDMMIALPVQSERRRGRRERGK